MKRQTFNHVGKSDVERSKDAQTSISTDAQGLKVSFKIHLKTFQKMPSMLNRFRKKVTKLTNHYSATLCCVHVTLAALGCLFVGTERMRVRVCVSACVRLDQPMFLRLPYPLRCVSFQLSQSRAFCSASSSSFSSFLSLSALSSSSASPSAVEERRRY